MHDDQRDVDAITAGRLIADQFPRWAAERVVLLPGSGTVNTIFRVGDELTARFPLAGAPDRSLRLLAREASAMEEFAGVATVDAPRPVAIGAPGAGYPLHWTVQTWVEGAVADPGSVARSESFADDLAGLISALRAVDTRGRRFAGEGRGGDFTAHDAWMAECIARTGAIPGGERLANLWTSFRGLPRSAPDVMTHGDLIPANVLVRDGRLVGVLDSGGFGPADPALELVAAWHLLDSTRRDRLRAALGSDDLEWLRGAGWAFVQAMGLEWYYRTSNPTMAALGVSTLRRLLADPEVASLG